MRRLARVLAFIGLLLCAGFGQALARADAPVLGSPRGAPSRISVLTMGPGDHPFSSFGHTALLVEWGRQSRVYNFGTFEFQGLRGIEDFLAGRFRYWLSVSTLPITLAAYRAENRTMIAQDLNLTRGERLRLARALDENARPENRHYNYDYYKDNCTTRVRDAVDAVLGGAFERSLPGAGELTFREHTERLSAANLSLYVGLDAALGRHTDQVPTRFGELWVPDTLANALDEVVLERNGRSVPLVKETRVLATAERAPPLIAPPSRAHWFGLTGLAVGGALGALGLLGARQRAARRLYGAILAAVGASAGLLGTVLLGFWFTKHWAAHQNYNILVFGPWALGLVITGFRLALGGAKAADHTYKLLGLCTAAAALGTLLPLLPTLGQDNLRLAAFMLPLWAGLCVGARAILRSEATPSFTPAPPAHVSAPLTTDG